MDRTSILKIGAVGLRPGLALIALALLLASAIPSSALQATPAPRQPAASASVAKPAAGKAETAAVEALMERAGTVQPGTFAVTGETLTASADELPLVIQADALRGSDKAVRIVVALGSRVTLPAVTRARIVTVARPGAARSVLSEISGTSAAGLVRSVGNAVLQPGEYELQAAVAQRGRRGDVLVSFTRAPLVIPDLWQGGLAVSPIVLADAVATAPAASAGSAFAFGPTALWPATTDRFAQARELSVAFRVFNWSAPAEGKPDLSVEYVFYESAARGRHFFNKLKPQLLNTHTLGERFDAASGAVNSGMTIPLQAFPIGEFQLVVRVMDNRTKQVATQETRFSVVP